MTALGTIRAEAKACRAAFADSQVGDAVWCLHHDTLMEWLTEPAKKRIAYILSDKPKPERARRLREFRLVKGPLPKPFVRAGAELSRAWVEYGRAWAAYDRTGVEYDLTGAAYVRARAAYDRARAAYDRTGVEALPALEAQHRAEYPDSTWNGRSIFGDAA